MVFSTVRKELSEGKRGRWRIRHVFGGSQPMTRGSRRVEGGEHIIPARSTIANTSYQVGGTGGGGTVADSATEKEL